jgi:hypothetical protein
MTIAEFAQRYLAPVPVEKIALINHADPDTRFEKGTVLKMVVGQVVS